jgi:6-phosphogluconolactonase
MTTGLRSLCACTFALSLLACTSSPGREPPADASDAVNDTRDAGAGDAARDGAQMQSDARVPGSDATTTSDAQADAAAADASGPDAALPSALESFVYIGGSANGDYPVKTYALNRESGALSELNTSTAFGPNPSFITPNAAGTLLYLTNEAGGSAGVTVASISETTGLPSKLEKRDDSGSGLVHASIGPNGKFLLAADYNSGRLVDFPIGGDGKLGAAVTTISFGGSAQTHSSAVHPSGKWAYSPNKGLDIIGQFSVDASSGQLSRLADLKTTGDGPRMISLTPSGEYAYVMFENDSSVEAYQIGQDGLLKRIDRKGALPDGFSGTSTGAHALVHPSGKFLYVSNRGANTVAAFTIGDDGKLTLLSQTPTEGNTPRCFDIDKQGRWLVVANQDSGSLYTFEIGSDGKLTRRGTPITGLKSPQAVAIVTRAKP